MQANAQREPSFIELVESTDNRGASFSVVADTLARIGPLRDLHIAAIVPGAIRGNHFHAQKNEIINVIYEDRWSFTWDTGEDTPVETCLFEGSGGVAIVVPPLGAHAVKNEGDRLVWIVATSDRAFDRLAPDPSAKDTFPRRVKW